ncbi:MAG: hypothetical protein C5B60_11885 [Chloroflexi bacterium]|nr:MAG: hypothetical protein C5B60_11885 [Chloroflexota bacterium]
MKRILLFLFFVLPASALGQPVAHAICNGGDSGNPLTCTTPSVSATGANLILIAMATADYTNCTLSDSTGMNTYTGPDVFINGQDQAQLSLWSKAAPVVSGTQTFTATCTGSAYIAIAVQAWANATASPNDVTPTAATAAPGTASIAPGSITPTQAAIVVTAMMWNPVTPSVNNSFTISDTKALAGGLGYGLSFAWKTQGAVAINPTWTNSDTTYSITAAMADYKTVVTAAGPKPGTLTVLGDGK